MLARWTDKKNIELTSKLRYPVSAIHSGGLFWKHALSIRLCPEVKISTDLQSTCSLAKNPCQFMWKENRILW